MMFEAVFDGSPMRGVLRQLGSSVLADMPAYPALVAAVDQHAAAVRESIRAAGEKVGGGTLARYLEGFVDGARAGGWEPAEPVSGYDWETLRLAAICWMAREHGLLG